MWLSISNYLSPHYHSIEEGMCSDEQGQDLNSENKAPSWEKSVSGQGKPIFSASLTWIILTFIFATLSAYLYFCSPTLSPLGTFENGFLTDFGPATSIISIHQREFTGSPQFSNGAEYIPQGSETLRYIGDPSPEIDDSWNALTRNRYFLLSDEEAYAAWGDSYKDFWSDQFGGYLTGFDMFHTLHCLDHIRQAFYPDIYHQTPIHGQMHRDHCIDHLRQMVMCYGDITPIPTMYFEGIKKNYIDSNRRHTCRNFQQIRDYVWERVNGSLAVPPRWNSV
ncbi:hypothetical protein OIDMADRAFT_48993 [Oidiodendron maius Zn]|uniref:DUF3328 domain-containing protein n=1 Tax=Oidiodendron maius (strain Zn) TaxID=913774 RepID=A0A0C3E492_OIDMZ|nr:hypothetical protein OIDMADRAFT_48993 [Oidiodendron maius Zn]